MIGNQAKWIAAFGLLLSAMAGCKQAFWAHNDLRPVPKTVEKWHGGLFSPMPRFHAVPTQPVLTPQCNSLVVLRGDRTPPPNPSVSSAPPVGIIESTPSQPVLPPAPEPIPPPPPDLPRKEVESSAPRQLTPNVVPPSWVFSPTPPESISQKMTQSVIVPSNPDAKAAGKAAR